MHYTLLRLFAGLLFTLGWRPVITGSEHVPATGPVIIASNHLSFIDSIVIPLAVPHRRVTFLAKAEYFSGGGLRGWPRRAFFKNFGAVPVRRGSQADARAAMEATLAVLQRGWACCVYPEGTRSRDGRLYRGRTGIGYLAFAADAPVVPAGLVGTDRMQPVGSRRLRPAKVRIAFAPPVRPQDYADVANPGLARRRLTDDVMDAIAALSGQERAEGYNILPTEV